MNVLTLQVVSFLLGAGLMLALLGLVLAAIVPNGDRWNRRFFIAYFMLLVLYIGLVFAEEFINKRPDRSTVLEVFWYFETVFVSLLLPLSTTYLLHCCGENWQHSTLFRAVAAVWIALFIMLTIAPFTTWFYYVTADNQFTRGPLYSLMTISLEVMLILNFSGVIRRRSRLPRRYCHAFFAELIPMLIVVFIHLFVSVFELFGISIATCALSMYGIILSDQIEQNLRQQREIAHQRASILVLQMRPHFIYNTMMSIYYLCKQDPDLAQRVTLDFTTYLRKNFTAIASEKLIPFSEELEHTRAYLAVEQAQFEDGLFVSYDTPHTDFFVPPLTLQPIVENAVKHGMDPDSEPLHILIRTRRTDSGSEIVVENNGADFEPADDHEPHIALENIQQRLEMMCRGKMTIIPRDGGGTVVKVTIP